MNAMTYVQGSPSPSRRRISPLVGLVAALFAALVLVWVGAGSEDAQAQEQTPKTTVWAWGQDAFGQLGDSPGRVRKTTPVQAIGLSGVQDIDGGADHSLALKSDGTVWAWGRNSEGQLGDGTTTQDRTTPVRVSELTGVQAIAGGSFHSLALKSDGTVWAWGYNGVGELGDGTTTNRTTPVQVSGLSGVRAIAAGEFHSLAVVEDTTAPKVKSTSPANGATQIAPGVNVTATFTEAMDATTTDGDPRTITGTTFKLMKAGTTTPIGAVVSYDATAKKAILNPNSNLRLGTKYKAVVTTGAQDLVGNRLDQNSSLSGLQQKSWTFTIRN